MCVDEKVIYLQIKVFVSWSYQVLKRMAPFFFLLWNPETVKRKKKKKGVFAAVLMLAQGFCPLFFFHISVYKKFCLLFTMGLVLHFEVNKRICIAW